jgi:predicted Zn-dependent protease
MNWKDHVTAAEGFLELGLPSDACEELNKLSPEDRQRAEVLRMRFHISSSIGDWQLAKAVATRLVDAYPDNPKHWLSLAAAANHTVGKTEAEEVLQQATTAHSKDAGILYALAGCASIAGRIDAAYTFLEEALRIEPSFRQQAITDPAMKPVWDHLASFR